jgi:hypothetical protein
VRITTSRVLTALATGPLVLLAGACASPPSESATTPRSTESSAELDDSQDNGASPDSTGDAYVAGVYTAEADYQTPDGRTDITVEMTLAADGTVEAIEVTPGADIGNSFKFQTQFVNGIGELVTGRPIDEIAVTKVAGSSLTAGGFNAAAQMIMVQAEA